MVAILDATICPLYKACAVAAALVATDTANIAVFQVVNAIATPAIIGLIWLPIPIMTEKADLITEATVLTITLNAEKAAFMAAMATCAAADITLKDIPIPSTMAWKSLEAVIELSCSRTG